MLFCSSSVLKLFFSEQCIKFTKGTKYILCVVACLDLYGEYRSLYPYALGNSIPFNDFPTTKLGELNICYFPLILYSLDFKSKLIHTGNLIICSKFLPSTKFSRAEKKTTDINSVENCIWQLYMENITAFLKITLPVQEVQVSCKTAQLKC